MVHSTSERGAMMVFWLLVPIASFLACVPAWYVARRRAVWFEWDYLVVFLPLPLWLAFVITQIGWPSMSNFFVELLVILAFVPFALSLRVFLLDRFFKNPEHASMAVCAVCLAFPLVLRATMPYLPE
jgi:hypothetical protein